MTGPRKIEDDLIKLICEKYNNGLSCKQIASESNMSNKRVSSILRKNGIKINPYKTSNRKYSLNEHYFDKIDSEEKAYWLGVLYSDGYNQEVTYSIKLGLQARDKELLDKFSLCVQSNKPLYFKSRDKPHCQDSYHLVLNSRHMSKQLALLGCWQNKSLNLQFPSENQIPKHLMRHWLRGMWDGDGCYSLYTSKENRINASAIFSGTSDMCIGISNFLLDVTNIKSKIYLDKQANNGITSRLQLSGNKRVMRLIRYLYKDSSMWMYRKYLKCQSIEHALKTAGLIKDSFLFNCDANE